MVLNFDQEKELETLKQSNKLTLIDKQLEYAKEEHKLKIERLNKLLEIALAGGNKRIEEVSV